jgi:hypothetical protein
MELLVIAIAVAGYFLGKDVLFTRRDAETDEPTDGHRSP